MTTNRLIGQVVTRRAYNLWESRPSLQRV